MSNVSKILIIQNTSYHFETAIALYKTLKLAGYDPYLYRCCNPRFGQNDFISQYNIQLADESSINNSICAFVVSAYPNPNVSLKDSIPNDKDNIFAKFNNKIIYISHRFNKLIDYTQHKFINKNNTLCLSPLSLNIGIDYINLVDNPIVPQFNPISKDIYITIQGHFELANKDYKQLKDWIPKIAEKTNVIINLLGTNIHKKFSFKNNPKINVYQSLNEDRFYSILNNNTHFLMSGLTPSTRNKTYQRQRYSSTFSAVFTMEKPVICHPFFQKTYQMPGICYENYHDNFIIEKITNITAKEYSDMVLSFGKIKNQLIQHNNNIIHKKIQYLIT
jgi:hypothetical protein